MIRTCGWCGASIVRRNSQARFCSSKCRVYAHRAKLPHELIERDRWVRYLADKRPVMVDGSAASSTSEATWTSYGAVKNAPVGVGPGFVLGDGIGCIDLDHCLVNGEPNEQAASFLSAYPDHYVEVSPSGDGLHIWGSAEAAPGSRKTVDGLHVERYSTGRYITVTGRVFQRGSLLPL